MSTALALSPDLLTMNQYRANILWIAASNLGGLVLSVPLAQAVAQGHCGSGHLIQAPSLCLGSADRPARDAVCGGENRSTQLLKRGGSIRVNEPAD